MLHTVVSLNPEVRLAYCREKNPTCLDAFHQRLGKPGPNPTERRVMLHTVVSLNTEVRLAYLREKFSYLPRSFSSKFEQARSITHREEGHVAHSGEPEH